MSKPKQRQIVIITPGFPKDEQDTSCIPALQIYVEALSQLPQYHVRVLALHYPNTTSGFSWNRTAVQPMGWNNKKSRRILGWNRARRQLRKWHQQHPVDVVHSFWLGEAALLGEGFAQKHNLTHLCTLMGQDAREGNRYFKLLPIRKMKLITLSENHKNTLMKSTGIDATIIPWGLAENASKETPQRNIDILGVGSLIPLKRWDDFIAVCAILHQNIPKLRVTLVGAGPLQTQLEAQCRSLGLEDTIQFTGGLTYDQTQQLMASSKVLLHPSEYESFGMVFIEALQQSLYIVSRNVGVSENLPNWAIRDTVAAMAEVAAEFLSLEQPAERHVYSVMTTVEAYQKLYDA